MRKMFFAGLLFLMACDGDGCEYKRPVSGKITGMGQRIKGGDASAEEKIALQLKPFKADSKVTQVAAGADGLAIECLSTRCAALEKGQCVSLLCRWVARTDEPDVVQCKMDRTIPCE